jgi:pyridinium-3,5-bisthiocarboxylic acid mononucleotide nickel chelatase
VLSIIEAGTLPERARARATAVFRRLAEAEARVHGESVDEVHFHEVGAIDAIVDVVGSALGLELLGIDEVWCSELPLTTGRVRSRHGELPVPAPATTELLRGTEAVWRPLAVEGELVTPTGAAIVATMAHFGRPSMRMEQVGYGFGERTLPWANCLRLIVGGPTEGYSRSPAPDEADTVVVIEANIDDMTGEALGWLLEHLFAQGALDVSFSPLSMKKNRPGTQVTILAAPALAETLARELLRSSTTLGVRLAEWQRLKAGRRVERIVTPLGEARVKLKLHGAHVVGVSAEYEDARALAEGAHLPVHEVLARVEAAARAQFGLDASATPGESS